MSFPTFFQHSQYHIFLFFVLKWNTESSLCCPNTHGVGIIHRNRVHLPLAMALKKLILPPQRHQLQQPFPHPCWCIDWRHHSSCEMLSTVVLQCPEDTIHLPASFSRMVPEPRGSRALMAATQLLCWALWRKESIAEYLRLNPSITRQDEQDSTATVIWDTKRIHNDTDACIDLDSVWVCLPKLCRLESWSWVWWCSGSRAFKIQNLVEVYEVIGALPLGNNGIHSYQIPIGSLKSRLFQKSINAARIPFSSSFTIKLISFSPVRPMMSSTTLWGSQEVEPIVKMVIHLDLGL